MYMYMTSVVAYHFRVVVAIFNTSLLEVHIGFFRLLMKGISDPYVLQPFDKKLIS